MSDSQPPGWYPAPGSPAVQRWWDGIRWTGEVREADNPSAPPPAGPPTAGPAAGHPPAGTRSLTGWTVSWPGSGVQPVQPAAERAAASRPDAAPESQADLEAAWRAPAVEAWEAKTAPGQGRKRTRRFGRGKPR